MNIVFHKQFKKKFKKLTPKVQNQFLDRLELFTRNNFHPTLKNHAVHGAFEDCRSINVTGDYRAIYKIEKESVIFITIGTHSDLFE